MSRDALTVNLRLVVAGLALAALTGCGSQAPAGPPRPVAELASPTATAVTDCGTFTLGQGDRLPDTAVDCLREAVRDRRRARLEMTAPTTEGDPIRSTYLSDASGRVEVVTDTRQDRFGPRTIQRQTCTDMLPERSWVMFEHCA
jgi:hypothetical protein